MNLHDPGLSSRCRSSPSVRSACWVRRLLPLPRCARLEESCNDIGDHYHYAAHDPRRQYEDPCLWIRACAHEYDHRHHEDDHSNRGSEPPNVHRQMLSMAVRKITYRIHVEPHDHGKKRR